MVYEKYIKKNGKIYGPYTYHSKRVDGKVVSEYHGPKKKLNNKNFIWIFLGIFLVFLILGSFLFFNQKLTAKVALDINSNYKEGETLKGVMKFFLKKGEFIPASSSVIIETGSETYEYDLKDLVSENPSQGNFYAEGVSISGEGQGYGSEGLKTVYPDVLFTLNVLSEKNSGKSSKSKSDSAEESSAPEISEEEIIDNNISEEAIIDDENNSEMPQDESVIEEEENNLEEEIVDEETDSINSEEMPQDESVIEEEENNLEEEIIEESVSEEKVVEVEKEEKKNENSNQKDKERKEKKNEQIKQKDKEKKDKTNSVSITGAVIGGFLKNIFHSFQVLTGQVSLELMQEVDGKVSFGESFVYELDEDETAEIQSDSVGVMLDEGFVSISEDHVDLRLVDNQAIVTTEYSKTMKGFGEGYLGEIDETLTIDLSQLNLVPQGDSFKISLVYNDVELVSITDNINDLNKSNKSQKNKSNSNINDSADFIVNETQEEEILIENKTEVVLEILTDEEKQILFDNYGNVSVDITRAEKIKDRIEVYFKLENYSMKLSYDENLSFEELSMWIERDRIKFLKDIANELSREEVNSEVVEGIVGSYGV